MEDNKLVEKYDDNPGAYFGMLVESLLDEDSYSSNGSDNRQVNFSKGSYAGKSEWSSNSKYGSSGKSYSDDWGSKKYQTTDKDKASDSYYKQNQKAQDDMKKNGNAVEEISKLSKDVADYTERKMETVQINGSSVQCKGVGDINNFKKRLLKHGYTEEKASGDWNSIFANDKVSNAKLGITNKGAVVLFYQNPQKESLKEDYVTDLVAEILGKKFPMNKRNIKWLSNNGTSGEVEYKGQKFAFRKLPNGEYKVMRSSDAGWNWSETLFKDESLKEQKEATRDEKIKAISSNPEARKQAKELTDKGELPFNSIVDFVYADFFGKSESLKEDKFVSRDKMSKKDRKELDNQKRNTWGSTNPVTRVQPNKKAYDRKRDKKVVDEDIENKDSEEYLGVDEVKRFVNAREKLLDISDSMTTDLRLGRISREDVLYYRNEIKEIYSFLNSLYFGR